jgi:hypothetical protein
LSIYFFAFGHAKEFLRLIFARHQWSCSKLFDYLADPVRTDGRAFQK